MNYDEYKNVGSYDGSYWGGILDWLYNEGCSPVYDLKVLGRVAQFMVPSAWGLQTKYDGGFPDKQEFLRSRCLNNLEAYINERSKFTNSTKCHETINVGDILAHDQGFKNKIIQIEVDNLRHYIPELYQRKYETELAKQRENLKYELFKPFNDAKRAASLEESRVIMVQVNSLDLTSEVKINLYTEVIDYLKDNLIDNDDGIVFSKLELVKLAYA